jgi:Tfp pilus assembly protein PilZ
MTATPATERRRHERLTLEPMYTAVTIQRIEGMVVRTMDGHAYDISLGGARIEVDEPMNVGDRIALSLRLPGELTCVYVCGRVVWVNDDVDDPGPRRLAVQFTRFLTDDDRTRLLRYMSATAVRRAA